MAPHQFPFLLIDKPRPSGEPAGAPRELEVGLTSSAALLRGEGPLSLFLLLEIAAQAVLHLAGGAVPAGEVVMLAGVEEMSFAAGAEQRPPAPGDRLQVRAFEEARIAKLIKMRVEIDRDGQRLADAVLLLASA